jgi:hypothetical protein
MAKSDVDRLTEEKVGKGGVLARLYFDMQSKNRDDIQPALVELINEHLLKERGVVYCYGTVDEPLEKEGTFITSAIVTVLVETFITLVNIAFNYSPAGVEILKPDKEMYFKPGELQSMLLDISQISLSYSRYVLEKVLKPEDLEKINAQMENRALVGKRLMEKKEEKKEEQGKQ